jgi:RNA polymerase sigma-70 factor (ECF subfamily)
LESVERRAFKQAMFAVHQEESALDIVQDAMLKLAEKYGDRPDEEFPMLFQRILQNHQGLLPKKQSTFNVDHVALCFFV